jgi:hypothetical protein
MIPALIVAGLVTVQGVALLIGARAGVVTVHVRRPPRPRDEARKAATP